MTGVATIQRRVQRARALRLGAVAAGLAAITLGLGGGLWAVAPALLLVGARRPTAIDAAARLDAQLDGDGAARTAWDHRADVAPMAVAQRRRIEARLTDAVLRAAAPNAHPAWALCLGLLAWPLLQGPPADPGGGPAVASAGAAAGPASAATASTTSDPAAPRSATPKAGVRSAAPRLTPPTGPTSEGGGGGGAAAKVAGVGARAGDRQALPVTADRVGLSPGTAAGIWLSDASGAPLPEPPIRVALAPPAGPPDDDITDPARPYPRRYRTLIARWFAR